MSKRDEYKFLKNSAKNYDKVLYYFGMDVCRNLEEIIRNEYPGMNESLSLDYMEFRYKDKVITGKNKMGVSYDIICNRDMKVGSEQDPQIIDFLLVNLDQYNTDDEGKITKSRKRMIYRILNDKDHNMISYHSIDCSDFDVTHSKFVFSKVYDHDVEFGRKYAQQLRMEENYKDPEILKPYIKDILSKTYNVKQNCIYSETENNKQIGQKTQIEFEILDRKISKPLVLSQDKINGEVSLLRLNEKKEVTRNYSALVKVKIYNENEEKPKKEKFIFHFTVGKNENSMAYAIRHVEDLDFYLKKALTEKGFKESYKLYREERDAQKESVLTQCEEKVL